MSDSSGSVLKIIVIVLAIIGGIAILGVIGMVLMHFWMMGRWSC